MMKDLGRREAAFISKFYGSLLGVLRLAFYFKRPWT
jgi:hypothetical protein